MPQSVAASSGAGGQTCCCLWSHSAHWSNLSGDSPRPGPCDVSTGDDDVMVCVTLLHMSHRTLLVHNVARSRGDREVTASQVMSRLMFCHNVSTVCHEIRTQPEALMLSANSTTHSLRHTNVTNPCYVTPVCHDGKLGQTPSRRPARARGPGVAPGRDQAAVPGHDRPRHALHRRGERRVYQCQHRGKPQNCQSGTSVNVSVIHPS